MISLFKSNGQLSPENFDQSLLQPANYLDMLKKTANDTKSQLLGSTHLLIALAMIPDGVTANLFDSRGVKPTYLIAGLKATLSQASEGQPLKQLLRSNFDESALAAFSALEESLSEGAIIRVTERDFLIVLIKNLAPMVADNLVAQEISPQGLIAELELGQETGSSETLPAFSGEWVDTAVFASGGKRILDLLKTEAEALGYASLDPRHLLLALLEYEGGAIHSVLYQQGIAPRVLHERVLGNLRTRARRVRSQLELRRDLMSTHLAQILEQAGYYAGAGGRSQIAEVHLLQAFLRVDTFALNQMIEIGIDLTQADEAAQRFDPEQEAASGSERKTRSWEEIKTDLESALVGQTAAVEACLPFIRRMQFGFKSVGKPVGVFLFCGPSGTGKTELAKAIARAVFGSEEHLLMIEMGQFQTKESMNIFIGAPPGYIGYGEGKLTNGLRDMSRAVVLFDEVEKAHPEVFDVLLRFIDEGRIDDPAGPIRDGSECIIVMTSNISMEGLEALVQEGSHSKNRWEIRRKLRESLLNRSAGAIGDPVSRRSTFQFRPEFLNRIDEIILFRQLAEVDLAEISRRYLIQHAARLKYEKQIEVTYTPNLDVAAHLAGAFCGTLPDGARAARRVTQMIVVDPIIDFVYEHEYEPPLSLAINVVPELVTGEPRGVVSLIDTQVYGTGQ